MYADYTFYTGAFYGTAIDEADFPRLSSRASDFLDYYTQGRAERVPDTDTATVTALAKACCAIAEQMKAGEDDQKIAAKARAAALASETGEFKSETVGPWSASYTTAADYMGKDTVDIAKAQRAAYAALAAEYLYNTGLLYRGGCCK